MPSRISSQFAKQEYIWTPNAAGYYEVACSVYDGGHCAYGQAFPVYVTMAAGSETSSGDSAKSSHITPVSAITGNMAMIAALLF
eukprot:scaffold62990_cov34-Prasinocladus_malaysianus.AAC.1